MYRTCFVLKVFIQCQGVPTLPEARSYFEVLEDRAASVLSA